MIPAENFVSAAKEFGFTLWTGVPCSYLKPFINYVIDSTDLTYVAAANEGDAVGIAAGAELAGKRAIVMFQNSGFGNTVNPLTSMNMIAKIPSLVITTWRGEPGGAHDEPQHELMGQITPALFDLMKIKWEFFPTESAQVLPALKRAVDHMNATREPYGLIMRKDSVEGYKLKSKPAPRTIPVNDLPAMEWPSARPTRREVLATVQKVCGTQDAIFATTGFTGRVLYALEDRPNQLYMVGGMGCASSVAQGFAWAKPATRTVCLDGDGAALMRLGALATIGFYRPKNLVHIVLDNEVHDSTGGQTTVSHSVDLARVAAACGYPKVVRVATVADLENFLRQPSTECSFVHIKIAPGESDDLPRPKVTPAEVAQRMREWARS